MATISNPFVLQQCRLVSTKVLYPKQFKSVLSSVPPRPRSGWQIFVRDHFKEIKQMDDKAPATKATHLLSERWQKLSEAQKQKYTDQYQKEAKLHEDAVKKALTEATPQQIHDENVLRRKYNLTLLKDPKQPKRPLNSYMLYLDYLRLNGPANFKQLPVAEQAHEGSKKFKLLTPSEKEVFERKAKENRETFAVSSANVVKEIQRINQRELGTSEGWSDTGSWHAQYKDTAWIFVANLDYELTEGDVVCIFSQYGEPLNVEMARDKKTGKSMGFAFLQYENQKSSILAVDNLNGSSVLSRTIRVDHSYGPKKSRHDEDDEETYAEPTYNVAPPTLEANEETVILPKEKPSFDEEDPMADYFQKKRKKEEKKHHGHKHKSSDRRHQAQKDSAENDHKRRKHKNEDDSRHPSLLEHKQEQHNLRTIEYPRFIKLPAHGRYITPEEIPQWEDQLKNGEKAEEVVTLTGRIASKRESSAKLIFYDVIHNGETVQVVASRNRFDQPDKFLELNSAASRGDIFAFTGVLGKTKHGQLCVFTNGLQMLAPCLRDLPRSGLKDPEKRFRQRYLDMLVNSEPLAILRTRSQIIRFIRQFLDDKGFLEVETPILAPTVGGASARPFVTRANALNLTMQLRIAPELYLKQLVIGGLDRVYEIGKQFRNEGVDADHNPEFTTCEFYQAYGNLEDLMNDTETMLSEMVQKIHGQKVIRKGDQDISFEKPFARIDIVDYLDTYFGLQRTSSVASMGSENLQHLCRQQNIHISAPFTEARILDKIISHVIEPRCIQPTFLYNHPLALSPLAKDITYGLKGRVAARFELFVAKKEIVNAYEELNDPSEQRCRFEQQAKDRQQGDIESPIPDLPFCEALEYGLPPTAGWGMGIDRLVQLLTNAHHIREVIAFPVVR